MITYVVTKCYNPERKVLQCLVWVTVDDDRHTLFVFVCGWSIRVVRGAHTTAGLQPYWASLVIRPAVAFIMESPRSGLTWPDS